MNTLQNKIDFAVVLSVKNANPNGDPLNGNRPRQTMDGYGEISDVSIKRKIRNRLMDMGETVFVQSDDRRNDGFRSLKDRANAIDSLKKIQSKSGEGSQEDYAEIACAQWIDVRSFGQVFAFKGDSLSVGVRGPMSVHPAYSISPVEISSTQITKSVNSITGEKKSSDTMGIKHTVSFGVYVFYGSINCQLAEKTGFTEEDAEKIHQTLITLFENDVSSARPDGSMEVLQVYWWKHNCKTGQYSSAIVHRSLQISEKAGNDPAFIPKSIADYEITLTPLEGLTPQIYSSI